MDVDLVQHAFSWAAACMCFCALSVGKDVFGGRKPGLVRFLFKTSASTSFMVAAVLWNAIGNPACMPSTGYVDAVECLSTWTAVGGPRFYMFLALVLCFAGDVLLLFPEFFIGGLVSFLLGHFAFLGVFARLPFDSVRFMTYAFVPLLLFGIWISRWLFPAAGKLLLPVIAYLLVILTMVGSAVGTNQNTVTVVAAVLFLLSDVGVARDKFLGYSAANRMSLFLYYAAVLLFASTLTEPEL